ncbi:YSIRK-type signal peptide-containing protein [Lactobacillus sp. PV037]|uniref:mucin-binding protein n=1 Tax=unclassified Lactobacillus TaxID=2620435 RepID=UPI002240DA8E|nr:MULTISPECIES: Rib/alpha-like domain-containing protein [unclassified Lactobacillus]QNQ82656.1 YSIRK-type signal peptide-containing protein [Lactobacillus sp. PV012]QNQ83228.1 YSIRK-type signal peptide-containing protein [Lactobacillus sp. PV037]
MLSKNNYKERLRKMEQKKERFSIRKFSVGAASVLIGFFFMGVGSQTTVHADTVTPQVETAKSNENTAKAEAETTDEAKAPASQAVEATSSAASDVASSQASSSASSAAPASETSVKNSEAKKETTNTVSVKDLESNSAAAKELTASKAVTSSAATSSAATHANGTGGYTEYGITVPSVTEPEASEFWKEFNQLVQPMSKEDLAKLGLDENTYYESATNKTKWHAVSWLSSQNSEGNNVELGTFLYHNPDGSIGMAGQEGTWISDIVREFLLNSDNIGPSATQPLFLVPIVDADMIYVHQGSTLTYEDIKKALASKSENLTGLVSGDWVTDQQAQGVKVVDTSVLGTQTGAARLEYKNGTQTSVSIPVTVIGPEGKEVVNVDQGDPAPSAASVITNDQQVQTYFPGTTYSWKEVPKTDVPGTFDATVVANWPDGQKTDVNTKIVVKQMYQVVDDNKTVTRTIVDNVPKQTPVTVVQKVNLTRKVTEDMSGKQLSATDWEPVGSNSWDEYTPQAVEGYTPNPAKVASEVVTGDTEDTKVVINYTANTLTQDINYVDRTTNNTISKQTVTGKADSDVAFTAEIPAGWVADQEVPTTISFGTSDPTPMTIYIKHGTEAITDPADTTKKVTRTVNYLDPVTNVVRPLATQEATLTRTGEKDLVTGEVTYSDWSTSSFDEVNAPAVAGYTVTNPKAAPAVEVTGNTQNSVVTFTYTANEQTQVVKFVDNDNHNNVVSQYDVDGKTGETVGLNIESHVPTNWVIANPETIPTNVTFGPNGNEPITVYVKHGTEAITDPADTTKVITRTINYLLPNDKNPEDLTVQKVTLTRTGEKDLVTGKVIYSDWSTGSFDQVNAPSLQGYYITSSAVAPAMTVTSDTPDSTVTFVYAASWHNQVISYVNKKTNELVSTDVVTGRTGSTVQFTPQVPAGWELSGGQSIPSSITFGTTDPKTITVYIQHQTKAIDFGTTKNVTRTIYTQIAGQSPMLASVQSVSLTRTATQDLVTGEITYGDWNTANFDKVAAPVIAGYTVTNPDAAPAMTVTGTTPNSTVIFNYNSNEQDQKIEFVNNADHNDIVDSYDVTGKTGETVNADVQSHVPTNWVITPNQTIPATVTFGTSGNAPIVVYVQHGTKEITNDQTSKTITRTINLVNPTNGATENVATQSVTLTRPATQDLVTGEITYGDWTSSNFGAVNAPEIAGYYPVGTQSAPAMTVTADTQNSTVTFTYAAAWHNQAINFVDNTTKNTIDGYEVTGKTGETVNANVESHVPTNWVITPNQAVPTTITFGTTNPAPITVYVQHGTKEITNDQTSKTVTRTVNVANPTTGKTEQYTVQTANLSRTATQDLVTGEITYGNWNSTSFKAVAAPSIAGYTVTNPNAAPAMTVTGTTPNSTVTFTYTADSHSQVINFVDNTNKTTVVGSYDVTGKTGETVSTGVESHVPTNWVIVPGSEITTQVTFGSTNPAPITVYVQHGTKEITNAQTSKTVTRTVNIANPTTGKTEQYTVQTAHLSRTATEDLVTGEITYGDWNTTNFDKVAAPEIAGYTVTNPDAAPAMTVTGTTASSTVTFTYTADAQHATIEYVNADDQSQVVKTDTVNGKTGETVSYKAQAPEGWVIVGNQQVPTQFTFGSTQMPVTKILVKQLQSYKYSVSTDTTFTTHVGATTDTPSLNPANANFNWTDKNGNPIAAPTGYKVSWKQAPSTSSITEESGILQITYSDGTTTDVKVPVTVKGATAINGNKVYQGEAAPEARLAVNTREISDFRLDSITWEQAPDTSVAGAEIPGVVSVNYADGTHQLVNVTIDVIGVEKGIDHKDDKILYKVIRVATQVSGTGSQGDVNYEDAYTRNKLTDYAYPVGNPKRVTYTKWTKVTN